MSKFDKLTQAQIDINNPKGIEPAFFVDEYYAVRLPA